MSDTVLAALIGLAGSGVGAFGGVLLSVKLISYRLEQLEKKVDAHNKLVERMYEAEAKIELHEEKIKVANHRIEDLEEAVS